MLPAAAGLVVFAVILVALPAALVGVYYDDGIYLALARSLAEGHGYHIPYLPGTPAAVHYPWGYPVFLAGLWKVWPDFPENVRLLRGANAVLMGLFAALAVGYAAPRLQAPRAVTALAIVAATTAIPVIAVATVLFAEPLFLVLCAAALWNADRAGDADVGDRRALRFALMAGVLAALATLTRSIGVAVVAGTVMPFALRKQWRLALAAGIPAALLLAPWLGWSAAHRAGVDPLLASNYGTYGDFLNQGGAQLSLGSLGELARPLGALALPPLGAASIPLGVAVLAALVIGVGRLFARMPALGWMLCWYGFIVALWPYGPDRFLWGALPWLAVALVAGIAWLANRAEGVPYRRAGLALAATATASVVIGFSWFQARVGLRGATSAQVGISATMNDILPWIRETTDSTAIIAGEDEALIWLYTGRRAVPSYLWRVRDRSAESFGPDSLHAWLERSGATHMILTGPGSDAAATIDALLSVRPGYLQVVRVWPGRLLAFRIHRGA